MTLGGPRCRWYVLHNIAADDDADNGRLLIFSPRTHEYVRAPHYTGRRLIVRLRGLLVVRVLLRLGQEVGELLSNEESMHRSARGSQRALASLSASAQEPSAIRHTPASRQAELIPTG